MTGEPIDPTTALDDVRVLQSGQGKAAAFCAKLLADLGAHVTVVDAAAAALRAAGPFHPDDTARQAGGLHLYLDAGKDVVADPRGPGLPALVADFDVLVEDEASESLELRFDDPALVRCSITPFGRSGPHAGYAASHLNLFHAGGESALVPLPGAGWPPLQSGSEVAAYDVGCHAAVTILAALVARRATGLGQVIDLSAQEVLLSENRTTMVRYFADGRIYDYNTPGYGDSLYPTADGHVIISFGVGDRAVAALAAGPDGEDFAVPEFADGRWRLPDQRPAFNATLRAWCQARPTTRVVEVLDAAGLPVGAVNGAREILASEQLRMRGFLRPVEHPTAGTVLLPGRTFRLSARSEVPAEPRAAPPAARPRPPLEGIRVLDFTWAAAGPYATYLLAHLGAEVIKVEHLSRPDSARRGFQAPPPDRIAEGPWPYGSPDSSPNFNDLAAGKRSIRLDLSHPGAAELVQRLLPHCDMVTSNFRPGVMDKQGLGAAELLAEHPHLIVAEVSASGSTGPERNRPGFANVFAAAGGLSAQTGFPDGPPTEGGDSVDFRCGSAVAYALLGALALRQRTGHGHFVDVACQEVVAAFTPDALLRQVLSAPALGRLGNHHPQHAPHNAYRAAGTNRWLTIVVETDDEWVALCDVLDRPDLAKAYDTAPKRKAVEAHLDDVVTRWTVQRDPFEATELLQRHGVRAMPCLSNVDLAGSDHLAARGMFRTVRHPVMGEQIVLRPPWVVAPDYRVPHPAGPVLGEANDYVLDEVLGVIGGDRERLAAALA